MHGSIIVGKNTHADTDRELPLHSMRHNFMHLAVGHTSYRQLRCCAHLPMATLQRLSAQLPVQRRLRDCWPSVRILAKQASMKPSSRRVPSSVATTALDSWVVSDTRMGWPLRKAPPPRTAWYISPRIGLNTTPTTGCLPTVSPMLTQLKGKRCTKLVVPAGEGGDGG